MIQVPQIKHDKSGLTKVGEVWKVLYYEDDKLRKVTTGKKSLKRAVKFRDAYYASLIEAGAAIRGNKTPAIQDAIDNPSGMACIYTQTSYRVVVGGTHVITTTDQDKAITRRNEHIKQLNE